MKAKRIAMVIVSFGVSLALVTPVWAQVPDTLLHSFFDSRPIPEPFAQQGWSVVLAGDFAVIGVPADDTGATNSGVVRVYDTKSGTLLHTLANPSRAVGAIFGSAVAISDRWAVVGAIFDYTGGFGAGSAFVYDLDSTAPTSSATKLTDPTLWNDNFGYSVAADGACVLVGAPYDDTRANNAGAAYLFGPRPALTIVPSARGFATVAWTPATSSDFLLQSSDSSPRTPPPPPCPSITSNAALPSARAIGRTCPAPSAIRTRSSPSSIRARRTGRTSTACARGVQDRILRLPSSANVLWFEYIATDIIGLATRFARRLTFSAFFPIEQPSAAQELQPQRTHRTQRKTWVT